jgi:CheY-like chemotaxis protein
MNATCLICQATIPHDGDDHSRRALIEHALTRHPERVRRGALFVEALGCFAVQPPDVEREPHASPEIEDEERNAAPAGPVLVVEDNEDVREAMLAVISSAGFSVRGARNGTDALEVLRDGSERPSLIVLDLMMPGMSGLEFRQHQLADAALSPIPLVVVTAYGRTADSASLRGADILGKPIDVDRMLTAVQKRCLRV